MQGRDEGLYSCSGGAQVSQHFFFYAEIDCMIGKNAPRSIAKVSEADSLTMVSTGSETAFLDDEMERALRASRSAYWTSPHLPNGQRVLQEKRQTLPQRVYREEKGQRVDLSRTIAT
mmetsp:Transcript_29314/g.43228  ORF Transcript_29314/g.43228 Transcript_29314/m.43228 type:complete len:117 (-) Transcript_29314:108-458(-)